MGSEYSSPDELAPGPAQSLRPSSGKPGKSFPADADLRAAQKSTSNGHTYPDREAMPDEERVIYDRARR